MVVDYEGQEVEVILLRPLSSHRINHLRIIDSASIPETTTSTVQLQQLASWASWIMTNAARCCYQKLDRVHILRLARSPSTSSPHERPPIAPELGPTTGSIVRMMPWAFLRDIELLIMSHYVALLTALHIDDLARDGDEDI